MEAMDHWHQVHVLVVYLVVQCPTCWFQQVLCSNWSALIKHSIRIKQKAGWITPYLPRDALSRYVKRTYFWVWVWVWEALTALCGKHFFLHLHQVIYSKYGNHCFTSFLDVHYYPHFTVTGWSEAHRLIHIPEVPSNPLAEAYSFRGIYF